MIFFLDNSVCFPVAFEPLSPVGRLNPVVAVPLTILRSYKRTIQNENFRFYFTIDVTGVDTKRSDPVKSFINAEFELSIEADELENDNTTTTSVVGGTTATTGQNELNEVSGSNFVIASFVLVLSIVFMLF